MKTILKRMIYCYDLFLFMIYFIAISSMLVVCSIPHSQNLDILKKSSAQVEGDFNTFMVLCMATSASIAADMLLVILKPLLKNVNNAACLRF